MEIHSEEEFEVEEFKVKKEEVVEVVDVDMEEVEEFEVEVLDVDMEEAVELEEAVEYNPPPGGKDIKLLLMPNLLMKQIRNRFCC